MTNQFTEYFRLNGITLDCYRIPTRTDGGDFGYIHWLIKLCKNGGPISSIEYSEGEGLILPSLNYAKPDEKMIYRAYKQGIDDFSGRANREYLQGIPAQKIADILKDAGDRIEFAQSTHDGKLILTMFTVKPPKIEDIIHSMAQDAYSGQETFQDFCDDCGYDTDSIKAHAMHSACREAYFKLKNLGLNLDELQTLFENY